MRKVYTGLLSGVLACVGLARVSSAEITMNVTGVTLSGAPGSPAQALHDNGWMGYLLTLQADATSVTVGGFDFASQNEYLTWYSTIPLNYGITGTFAQVWGVRSGPHGPIYTTSPTGSLPTDSPTAEYDSFFSDQITHAFFIYPFAEQLGGNAFPDPTQPVYPYPNSGSTAYTVGNWMGGTGAIINDNGTGINYRTQTLPFAFIITPVGQPVHVRGQVADGTEQANEWLLDFTFNEPTVAHSFAFGVPVPEPGALSMLAGGVSALMVTRRRRILKRQLRAG